MSALGKNVVDVVDMDMIIHPRNDAQPRLPLDVDIITNSASGKLADSVRASIERYTGLDAEVTVNPVAGSDHAPFWDIGTGPSPSQRTLPTRSGVVPLRSITLLTTS